VPLRGPRRRRAHGRARSTERGQSPGGCSGAAGRGPGRASCPCPSKTAKTFSPAADAHTAASWLTCEPAAPRRTVSPKRRGAAEPLYGASGAGNGPTETHTRAPTPVHGCTFSRPASRPAADDQAATGSRPPPFEKTNESGSRVTPDRPALPPKNAPHWARIATTAHTGLRPARRCSAEAGAFRGVRKVEAVGRDSKSTRACVRGSLCRNASPSPAIREMWLPGTLSGVASVASGAGREECREYYKSRILIFQFQNRVG